MIDGLNPGIRRTVALLRAHGFATTDSGDGETHDHACDRPCGYVAIVVAPSEMAAEADRVAEVLRAAGVRVEPRGLDDVEGVTHVQASYCPADGSAVIDVSPIHDRQLDEDSDCMIDRSSAAPATSTTGVQTETRDISSAVSVPVGTSGAAP